MKIIRKIRVEKASEQDDKEKVFRLTEIDPEFVSLVRAGANRQKSFMVVKADEQGLGPGGVCICPECGYTEEHATGEKCNEKKCEKCGTVMTRKAEDDAEGKKEENLEDSDQDKDDDTTSGDLVANTDTGKAEGDEGDDANDTSGGSAETEATDLSSWLSEAGTKVGELSMDLAIQEALDGQTKGSDDADTDAEKAQEINDAAALAVDKVGEEDVEVDERDEKIAKLEAELEESRIETRKARRENTALKAKNARMSKGIGKSSVILTGEVTAKASETSDTKEKSPSRGAFKSGGDIAAAVAEE